ncbi:hypothetical protein GCM10025864_14850 [Luteimicrobium album]|uniref:Uncharacterized protein n=1 Tax=Luteimicrobium album TaxID=1054550 RepID=A0ABQ6HZ01_9MICO|nr:hypothetical protein GCM10025864_14850 [Luteimicrobium album]
MARGAPPPGTTTPEPRGTGRLQQGRALPDGALVVLQHTRHARDEEDREVVEEPAAAVGVALHEREVLGREHDRPHEAQHITRAWDRRPVDPCPVRLAGDELEVDRARPVPPDDAGAHDRAARPRADQRGIRGSPVAAQRREVPDGLDEVRLALPVGTDEGVDPRFELEVDRRVRPEVRQGEVGDVHGVLRRRRDRGADTASAGRTRTVSALVTSPRA